MVASDFDVGCIGTSCAMPWRMPARRRGGLSPPGWARHSPDSFRSSPRWSWQAARLVICCVCARYPSADMPRPAVMAGRPPDRIPRVQAFRPPDGRLRQTSRRPPRDTARGQPPQCVMAIADGTVGQLAGQIELVIRVVVRCAVRIGDRRHPVGVVVAVGGGPAFQVDRSRRGRTRHSELAAMPLLALMIVVRSPVVLYSN